MEPITAATLLTALKLAKELTSLVTSLRNRVPAELREDVQEVSDKVYEVQSEVLSARQREIELTDRCHKLEGDIKRGQDWEAEKARYTLKSLPGGASVYALKPEFAAQEAPHWLCAGCFASGKKSHVQPQGGGVRPQWKCSRCDATFVMTRRSRQKQ